MRVRTNPGHSTVTPMPSGFQLHRQSLRHGDHRELAGGVGAEAEPALQPGHRRGVDDVAAFAMGADMRQEGNGCREGRPIRLTSSTHRQVSSEMSSMRLRRRPRHCLQTTWTWPNAAYDASAPGDAGRIGNITGNAPHIRRDIAQAFDGRRQRVRLDIGQHHLHAGLRKGPAPVPPDAARPARHECRPCRRAAA